MLNLKEKHNKWLTKVDKGDENYKTIARLENKWYLISNNKSRQIMSFMILLDNGTGLHMEYSYSVDKPELNPIDTTIVIKNENKMIFDVNGEYHSYGFDGIEASAKSMMIYLRTETIHFWVFAHNESSMVNVTYDLVHEENDATTKLMNSLSESMKPPLMTEVTESE